MIVAWTKDKKRCSARMPILESVIEGGCEERTWNVSEGGVETRRPQSRTEHRHQRYSLSLSRFAKSCGKGLADHAYSVVATPGVGTVHPCSSGCRRVQARSHAKRSWYRLLSREQSGQSGAFLKPVRRIYQGATSGESLRTLYAATWDSARNLSNGFEIPRVGGTCG